MDAIAISLGWAGVALTVLLAGFVFKDVVARESYGRTFVPGQRPLGAIAIVLLPLGVMLEVSGATSAARIAGVGLAAFFVSAVLGVIKGFLFKCGKLGTAEEQAIARKLPPIKEWGVGALVSLGGLLVIIFATVIAVLLAQA